MKPKQALASAVIMLSLSAVALAAAAQKPAPQPTEEQKLKDQVDAVTRQVQELKEKSDRAAMEKDYIERIQTDSKAYYEKAFNTQIIIISIIGVIVGLIGKFGVDYIVASRLAEASSVLRADFAKQLAENIQELKASNVAQLQKLKESVEKTINELNADVSARSKYDSSFIEALAFGAAGQPNDALRGFQRALQAYAEGKSRQLLQRTQGVRTISNILHAIELIHGEQAEQVVIKELQGELYDGLEEELAALALQNETCAQAIRKARPPKSQPF